jgi:energy-coupling factor transport system ATP-binding protein
VPLTEDEAIDWLTNEAAPARLPTARSRLAAAPAPTDRPIVVDVRDVSHRFGDAPHPALDRVSFTVGHGEIVAIAGANGSGKTTLVRHLNGLLRPTSGTVTVDGVDTSRARVERLAGHVGLVFQNPNHQLFARTIREELEFGPRNLGLPPGEIAALVDAALAEFGLDAMQGTHPYRVPRSVRRLVAIAAVATMQTPILVLDEPTTGQDGRTTDVIGGWIERLAAAGRTVIFATHDMELLARVAGRVLLLAHGRVIADGPTRTVLGDASVLESAGVVAPFATRASRRLWPSAAVGPAVTLQELVDDIVGPERT